MNGYGTTTGYRPRALSIRPPWAHLIIAGHKDVENRTWSTNYRGPLYIHAGKTWDPAGSGLANWLGIRGYRTRSTCPGGYLGAVTLVDVHPARNCCAPWGEPYPGVLYP